MVYKVWLMKKLLVRQKIERRINITENIGKILYEKMIKRKVNKRGKYNNVNKRKANGR